MLGITILPSMLPFAKPCRLGTILRERGKVCLPSRMLDDSRESIYGRSTYWVEHNVLSIFLIPFVRCNTLETWGFLRE